MKMYKFMMWFRPSPNSKVQFRECTQPLLDMQTAEWAADQYAEVNNGYCEVVVDGTVEYMSGRRP